MSFDEFSRKPGHNPNSVSKEAPQDDLPAAPVDTASIIQALWEQSDDKTFESVSKEGFVIPDADTSVELPSTRICQNP